MNGVHRAVVNRVMTRLTVTGDARNVQARFSRRRRSRLGGFLPRLKLAGVQSADPLLMRQGRFGALPLLDHARRSRAGLWLANTRSVTADPEHKGDPGPPSVGRARSSPLARPADPDEPDHAPRRGRRHRGGLAYAAAAAHTYRWSRPPTRRWAWTAAAPAGRRSTGRAIGASFSTPRWVRSAW